MRAVSSFFLAATVLLLPPAEAHSSDRECRQSDECKWMGSCAYLGGECVATSNAHCRRSLDCKHSGRCKFDLSTRQCVVTQAKCRRSTGCKRYGHCTTTHYRSGGRDHHYSPADAVCAAMSDRDCKGSLACKYDGLCAYGERGCQASTRKDCLRSDVCKNDGRCTPHKGLCIAGNDADCRRSRACKTDKHCTFLKGYRIDEFDRVCGIAVPQPAPRNQRIRQAILLRHLRPGRSNCSDMCKSQGRCTLAGRYRNCIATSDADCRKSDACKRSGYCGLGTMPPGVSLTGSR